MAGATNKSAKRHGYSNRQIETARASGAVLSLTTLQKHAGDPAKPTKHHKLVADMAARKAGLQRKAEPPAGWKAAARGEGKAQRDAATAARAAVLAKRGQAKRAAMVQRGVADVSRGMMARRKLEAPFANTKVGGKTASEWSARMSELQRSKPRPFDKLYRDPSRAPAGAKEKHDAQMREWNREYRRATKSQKQALELSNAAWRKATPAQQAAHLRRGNEERSLQARRDVRMGTAKVAFIHGSR